MAVLVARISAVILIILAGTIGLTGLLAVNKFQTALTQTIDDHYRAVIGEARSIVDLGVNLGLRLQDLNGLATYFGQEMAADRSLRFYDVADADGIVRLSSDATNVDSPVPPTWVNAAKASGGGLWTVADRDTTVVGLPLVTSFGAPLGILVVGRSNAVRDERMERVGLDMLKIGASVTAAGSLLLIPTIVLFLRGVNRRRRLMEAALAADGAPPAGESALGAAVEATREARRRLDGIQAEIDRIDQP